VKGGNEWTRTAKRMKCQFGGRIDEIMVHVYDLPEAIGRLIFCGSIITDRDLRASNRCDHGSTCENISLEKSEVIIYFERMVTLLY